MKNTVKYQYATDSSGKQLHISEINKNYSKNEEYFCIGCKQKIIPRLGDKRIHHFWHINLSNNCSKETYLHELGKKIFYDTYTKCLSENEPFYIFSSLLNMFFEECKYVKIMNLDICKKKEILKYDLTSKFNKIEYEKKQEKFRPDITLMNDYGEKIFVEIAVTHPCESEKIESKNRIIEINLKDESDLKIIYDKKLSEDNIQIKYYNFENFSIITEPKCTEENLSNYIITFKNGEQHTVRVYKRDLCKFIFENIDTISHFITIAPKISIKPKINTRRINSGGPKIWEIESKMESGRFRKRNIQKRKRR